MSSKGNGYTYNSLGLNSATLQELGDKQGAAKMHHAIVRGEPASAFNQLRNLTYLGSDRDKTFYDFKPTPAVLSGTSGSTPAIAGGSAGPLTLHSITSLIAAISPQNTQQILWGISTASQSNAPGISVNNNIAASGLSSSLSNATVQTANGFSGAVAYATGAGTADFNTVRSFTLQVSGGNFLSWDFTGIGQLGKGNLNGAQIVNTGSVSTSEGQIYLGRWLGNTRLTTNAGATEFGRGVNYAFGDSTVALPLNKRFTYSFAGGTPIVSGGGTVGLPLQGGTITVNTGTQAVQLNNFRFGFSAASAFGAALFTMNGAATYSSTYRFSGSLTGSCSGGNCGANLASTGGFAGRFTGATGTGIAMTYGAVTNNNAVGGVASAAFKR